MEEILSWGLTDNTIKSMLDINPYLINMTDEEIIEKKSILFNLGLSPKEVINIISSNSLYLSISTSDIAKLINYLKKVGFTRLDILIESNPYILNLDVKELDDYIKERNNNGEALDEIIDDLESNPYLFSEI